MKDISIGIYHKDHQYGKRLMEYLNHQKDFPMTASFTSDEEMFFKQEQEGDFECLVLAEETDYHGDFPVCRIGANESMGGMYCQSAKEIAAGIYHCLNVSPQIENERILGVYSPIPRLEISAFARNMAASNGWIYFGMQPYGHFEEDETDDLLLFYIKEHKEDIIEYFMKHQKKFDGCVGFAGASCYLDYRELSMQDYEWFFEKLREAGIYIIFDIGIASPPDLKFFGLFDRIFLPLMRQDLGCMEYKKFQKQMRKHGVWKLTNWEEVMLESWKNKGGRGAVALKELLKQRVMEKLNFSQEISDEHLKGVIQEEIMKISEEYPLLLSDKIRLNQEVFYALRRLDILQDLLEDDSVTEIMINGYKNIFIERQGKLHRYPGHFSDNEKLYQVIQQVASGANRMVNERNPIVDARLNDGSRVNIILPPISIDGATMTIRKFAKEPMTLAWLCEREAFSEEIAKFLKILVRARYNIFISGGTGSGKTTLLNGMSNCIPKDERIITIEDSAELKLNGIDNLVRLEMRNANAAGENQVDMKELIKAALRSRPDRIIVGEVRGEEALSMLNAMNTGHDGSISTGHANSCKDMLKRIETMVLMGVDMPVEAIRGQMASAIDVIIHLGRSFDGSRKLMEISEITGMAASQVALHPLFEMNEDDELTMRSELCDQKKLKEYGQYEAYQKLMESFKARDQPVEI